MKLNKAAQRSTPPRKDDGDKIPPPDENQNGGGGGSNAGGSGGGNGDNSGDGGGDGGDDDGWGDAWYTTSKKKDKKKKKEEEERLAKEEEERKAKEEEEKKAAEEAAAANSNNDNLSWANDSSGNGDDSWADFAPTGKKKNKKKDQGTTMTDTDPPSNCFQDLSSNTSPNLNLDPLRGKSTGGSLDLGGCDKSWNMRSKWGLDSHGGLNRDRTQNTNPWSFGSATDPLDASVGFGFGFGARPSNGDIGTKEKKDDWGFLDTKKETETKPRIVDDEDWDWGVPTEKKDKKKKNKDILQELERVVENPPVAVDPSPEPIPEEKEEEDWAAWNISTKEKKKKGRRLLFPSLSRLFQSLKHPNYQQSLNLSQYMCSSSSPNRKQYQGLNCLKGSRKPERRTKPQKKPLPAVKEIITGPIMSAIVSRAYAQDTLMAGEDNIQSDSRSDPEYQPVHLFYSIQKYILIDMVDSRDYEGQTVTVHVGLSRRCYTISMSLLDRIPSLYSLLKTNPAPETHNFFISLTLPDVDENIGHTLMHYLYTGDFQLRKASSTCDVSKQHEYYSQSVLAYCAALKYGLCGLQDQAKRFMEVLGPSVYIHDIINLTRTVYRTVKDDQWYFEHLTIRIQAAFDADEMIFMEEKFIDGFDETSPLNKVSCEDHDTRVPHQIMLPTMKLSATGNTVIQPSHTVRSL
ncbi:hypothetical protein BDV38DRAFT_288616 [Aspergillus pseudotamarii]|uniref:BTB domain-containing protein n=1 Tax=Aspergillus pseudotamarii TaxID=132259 RepID=A0A5N6S9W8_ASPPS|nr:uncharacterized protein BDV38DRAFT_288616 [Aspergillus pseudotamarii]KAE8131506.1 hypothetical protein BDV38DRAFT_288616 [Aspergillus pseudotamarii]